MKGIKSSQAIVAMFVVMLTTASAWAQYGVGFTWNRYDDWTPGPTNGSTAGNPMPDSVDNPVWSQEYIAGVPAGSDMDSNDPWYELPTTGMLMWQSNWGGVTTWSMLSGTPPTTSRVGLAHVSTDQSYKGDHYANVPLLTWVNPSATPLTVSLTSGPEFYGVMGLYMPTGSVADLMIARTDASDGNSIHLLYSETIVKTGPTNAQQDITIPDLAIDELVLDPGDNIIFGVRSRTQTTGFNWASANLFDDVNITVVPEPATLSLLAIGGLAMMRRRRIK